MEYLYNTIHMRNILIHELYNFTFIFDLTSTAGSYAVVVTFLAHTYNSTDLEGSP